MDVFLGAPNSANFEPGDALNRILEESIAHERDALSLYRALLNCVEGQSIYLEEYARTQIGAEEMHLMEMAKLLRDYTC